MASPVSPRTAILMSNWIASDATLTARFLYYQYQQGEITGARLRQILDEGTRMAKEQLLPFEEVVDTAWKRGATPPEQITLLSALCLMDMALCHIITGGPILRTFEATKLETTWRWLAGQRDKLQGSSCEQALTVGAQALLDVYWRIVDSREFDTSFERRRVLRKARTVIRKLEKEETAYWKNFEKSAVSAIEEFLVGGDDEHQ